MSFIIVLLFGEKTKLFSVSKVLHLHAVIFASWKPIPGDRGVSADESNDKTNNSDPVSWLL